MSKLICTKHSARQIVPMFINIHIYYAAITLWTAAHSTVAFFARATSVRLCWYLHWHHTNHTADSLSFLFSLFLLISLFFFRSVFAPRYAFMGIRTPTKLEWKTEEFFPASHTHTRTLLNVLMRCPENVNHRTSQHRMRMCLFVCCRINSTLNRLMWPLLVQRKMCKSHKMERNDTIHICFSFARHTLFAVRIFGCANIQSLVILLSWKMFTTVKPLKCVLCVCEIYAVKMLNISPFPRTLSMMNGVTLWMECVLCICWKTVEICKFFPSLFIILSSCVCVCVISYDKRRAKSLPCRKITSESGRIVLHTFIPSSIYRRPTRKMMMIMKQKCLFPLVNYYFLRQAAKCM